MFSNPSQHRLRDFSVDASTQSAIISFTMPSTLVLRVFAFGHSMARRTRDLAYVVSANATNACQRIDQSVGGARFFHTAGCSGST